MCSSYLCCIVRFCSLFTVVICMQKEYAKVYSFLSIPVTKIWAQLLQSGLSLFFYFPTLSLKCFYVWFIIFAGRFKDAEYIDPAATINLRLLTGKAVSFLAFAFVHLVRTLRQTLRTSYKSEEQVPLTAFSCLLYLL